MKKRLLRATLNLTVLFSLLVLSPEAASPLSVKVYPSGFITAASPTIRISVRIEPDERNRSCTLSLVGDNYASISDWAVPGLDSAVIYSFERRDLPQGEYSIEAILHRLEGAKWKELRAVGPSVTVLR